MGSSATAPQRARARSLWLRLLISLGLLAVLVSRIHPSHLVPKHPTIGTLLFLIAGLLLMGLSFLLAAWRWQLVLAVFGAHVRLRTLTKHYLAGQFVGNVLPSTVGGDVLRVSRSSKDVGATDVAFAAVVLERLTGFVALPVIMAIGFAFRPELLHEPHAFLAVAIAGTTVVLLALILLVAGSPQLAGRFAEHENWMRYVGAVHVGVDQLRRDPRDASGALGAAILYQLCVIASVFCGVHVLGIDLPNAAVLAFVPAVAMAQVAPISVGGLGVREGLLVVLLRPLGVRTGEAVAIGLLWYAMTLVVSLAGAPAFAIGHGRRAPLPDDAGSAESPGSTETPR